MIYREQANKGIPPRSLPQFLPLGSLGACLESCRGFLDDKLYVINQINFSSTNHSVYQKANQNSVLVEDPEPASVTPQ